MRLIKARVQNFKCIEDSGEFSLDQVTCLIGKNESGKTALLEALYKLAPVESDKANFDEEEFPRRHLSTYRQRQQREPANVLTTMWELEPDDVSKVEAVVGPGALRTTQVVVMKGYENVLRWALEIDEAVIVANLLRDAGLSAADEAPLSKAESVKELISALESVGTPSDKQTAFAARLNALFPADDAKAAVSKVLNAQLPRFVYFSVYHQLPGRVAMNDLKQRQRERKLRFEDKLFIALLDMTSTGLEHIEGMEELEKLVMELESVEAALTDDIKRFWSQNKHLEVRFRYDHAKPSDPPPFNQGFVFNTRIFNTRHRATVSFEERSHGFIWFFSFLVWFSQVKRQYGDNLVLLLDEPGLPLHGRAQKDLIQYINQQLRPGHQVIYTGHSPFLIDVENIFSVRTIEDVVSTGNEEGGSTGEILGTKVGQRVLSRDKDTLFPLQGVLGFDLAQTLFVGPYVVVVEGPTERGFFEWFSRQLAKRKREALDLRWAVCPAEGAGKISSFVTLFAGRDLKIAVFADYHDGQEAMIDRLEQSGLLAPGHVLRTSEYTSTRQTESDIEDLVGRDLYGELVNKSLKLTDPYRLPSNRPEKAPVRVVKEVEAHCRTLPPGFSEFGRYKQVEYLLGLKDTEIERLPGLNAALDRFESVFRFLNRLIGRADMQASVGGN
jgi:predicted ATP-dependent endonuclease of OLD family